MYSGEAPHSKYGKRYNAIMSVLMWEMLQILYVVQHTSKHALISFPHTYIHCAVCDHYG